MEAPVPLEAIQAASRRVWSQTPWALSGICKSEDSSRSHPWRGRLLHLCFGTSNQHSKYAKRSNPEIDRTTSTLYNEFWLSGGKNGDSRVTTYCQIQGTPI